MGYNTFKGARLDLEAYQGKATIDYEIEVLTDTGGDFDFSVYASISFKIFYRKHDATEVLDITPTTNLNVIVLDLTIAQTAALQAREYWYECYGTTAGAQDELVTFGIFKVV